MLLGKDCVNLDFHILIWIRRDVYIVKQSMKSRLSRRLVLA